MYTTWNKLVETKWNIKCPVKPNCIPKVCSQRCKITGVAVGLQEKNQKNVQFV